MGGREVWFGPDSLALGAQVSLALGTGIKLCSQEGLQEPLFLEGRLGEN